MVGGGGGRVLKPILVFSFDQAEQLKTKLLFIFLISPGASDSELPILACIHNHAHSLNSPRVSGQHLPWECMQYLQGEFNSPI